MTTLSDVQKTIAVALKNSQEFKDICIANAGSELSFALDSSMLFQREDLPYCVVHKFNKVHDENAEDEFILQVVFAQTISYEPIEVDGIKMYQEAFNIENITNAAIVAIEDELSCSGVIGEFGFLVSHYNIILSEVGEADDIQSVLTLKIEKNKYL